jgi:hypothetical protein
MMNRPRDAGNVGYPIALFRPADLTIENFLWRVPRLAQS